MTTRRHERVILHLDMDAFYAAVETREDPSLTGKPLIIGHRGRRGVVSTCSYEARRFGVHSAMPSVRAERLCPQAIWLPGRMTFYTEVSRHIRAILDDATPVVEPLSIDEAFLDLTGIASDLEGGRQVAAGLMERIRSEERLTASVGVAPNKFLAKVASDLEKPSGLVVLPLAAVPHRPSFRAEAIMSATAGLKTSVSGSSATASATRRLNVGLPAASQNGKRKIFCGALASKRANPSAKRSPQR